MKRELTEIEQILLDIARRTLTMPLPLAAVMGGMSVAEAKTWVEKLGNRKPRKLVQRRVE